MAVLRIAFMGTPDFAVPALRALQQAGHDVVAVYCQPPKPAGRGHQLRKSSVQVIAEDMGIEVRSPKTLRDNAAQQAFADLKLDIAVVAAYGLILPQAVLDAPRLGCINIHASLLPRWRGAAPIHRALLAGDTETGITIMQMAAGLDTGPMLLKETLPIAPNATVGFLHDELAQMGARLVMAAVAGLAAGSLKPQPQPAEGVTYAAKLVKEDGRIDWHKSAAEIELQIRGLQPWPGCFFMQGDEAIKVLSAEIAHGLSGSPGRLLKEDFTVACGQGAIRLVKVQKAGKGPIDGAAFLRGTQIKPGSLL